MKKEISLISKSKPIPAKIKIVFNKNELHKPWASKRNIFHSMKNQMLNDKSEMKMLQNNRYCKFSAINQMN